ncbi:copper resistance protein CopC [Timonella senegalensis]|uniref:copper resistance protein CopC n=1 Tax=Timonella senegalensis TaxID=1465825 RepID=UPI0028AC015E|nr:copper resistance protein CopC [Timonella senegalensis]
MRAFSNPAISPTAPTRLGASIVENKAPRTILAAAFAALLAVFLLLGQGPAAAHDVLVKSNPADGATLKTAPKSLILEFNNDIQTLGGQVLVKDASGAEIASGAPATDGKMATYALPALANGTYTAAWRVVSSDAHPIEGVVTFTVEDPANPITDDSAAPTSAPEEPAETESSGSAEPTTSPSATTSSTQDAALNDSSPQLPWTGIIIGGVLGLIAGIIGLVVANKRKK